MYNNKAANESTYSVGLIPFHLIDKNLRNKTNAAENKSFTSPKDDMKV